MIFWALPMVLIFSTIFTNYLFANFNPAASVIGEKLNPAPAYVSYLIYYVVFMMVAFANIISKYKKAFGAHKIQIQYVLYSTYLSTFLVVLVTVALPLLKIYGYVWTGPFHILIAIAFTGIAIIKTRLMDITVIIGRTAAYVIAIVIFGVGYLLLSLAYVNLFSSQVDSGFLGVTIIYGILVGEFFQRMRFFIQTSAEKTFLRGRYDYRKVLAKTSKSLSNCHNLDDIAQVVESTFKEDMDVAGARVVIFKQ